MQQTEYSSFALESCPLNECTASGTLQWASHSTCDYCDIVEGNISVERIYENDTLIAFFESNPQALIHFVVIPKKHIESLNSISQADNELMAEILLTISKLARNLGMEKGYRVIANVGANGGS